MVSKEIQITEYELDNCNGNLAQLSSTWTSVPKGSSSTVAKSKGKSADSIRDSLDLTVQVSASLQALLDNSVSFFTSMGIAFQESDEAASQHIDTITK